MSPMKVADTKAKEDFEQREESVVSFIDTCVRSAVLRVPPERGRVLNHMIEDPAPVLRIEFL
jgi:hypothetical protein